MADDIDVEEMLEAPFKKENGDGQSGKEKENRESRRSNHDDKEKRDRKRSRSRDRRRSRSRDKKRSRSRERKRSRSRERKRSRSRDRKRSRSRDRRRSRSRDRARRSRSRDRHRRRRSRSPRRRRRTPSPELTQEDRDARTVFCLQLAARIRPRDLEEFFSAVGKVRDVRLITDTKTRRSKGIAYVEFRDTESVPLAIGLNGQKLLGVPIIVQVSQAEKNRMVNQPTTMLGGNKAPQGPMRLYVGSLHFNITEDMLRGIFEPFGKIEVINLVKDDAGRSKGFGFVTFASADDAQKALNQLNGFELAGRPMRVGHVTEKQMDSLGQPVLDNDELDRAGIDLGATGRLQLMAKLAEGTGLEMPAGATQALKVNQQQQATAQAQAQTQQQASMPPIATPCFMLSNMFDSTTPKGANWEREIVDDVTEECNGHGGVVHIFVDTQSVQGNVYVKCPTIAGSMGCVNSLHGRLFNGRLVTAAYVPLPNYHQLFPDAARANQLVLPSNHVLAGKHVIAPNFL